MKKYEKILKDDYDKKEKVLEILKILDGEKTDDAEEILSCAKYFLAGCSTFNNSNAKTWLDSL